MKFELIIDKNCDEKVTVCARKKTAVIEKIEELVREHSFEFIGYHDKEAVRLDICDVYCFITENNRVYAITESEKLLLKCRLYQIEERLGGGWVRLNQSCIANIGRIKRFDASLSGTLKVILKNGYTDFVSRRQMKNVKERLGL